LLKIRNSDPSHHPLHGHCERAAKPQQAGRVHFCTYLWSRTDIAGFLHTVAIPSQPSADLIEGRSPVRAAESSAILRSPAFRGLITSRCAHCVPQSQGLAGPETTESPLDVPLVPGIRDLDEVPPPQPSPVPRRRRRTRTHGCPHEGRNDRRL
jgi:hypothetical protein